MDHVAHTGKAAGQNSHAWQHVFYSKAYRYRALLWKYWWIVTFTTAAGLAIGAWNAARQKVVYISSARMLISGKIALRDTVTFAEEMNNFLQTQQALMQDEAMRQRAAARVRVDSPEVHASPVQLTVAPEPGTTIYNLSATGSEPEYPPKFLQALMREFIVMRREMRTQKSEDTEVGLSEEIQRQQTELKKEEEKLLDFQRKNNVGFLEQEGNSAGAYLAKLNTQLADLKKEAQLLDLYELDKGANLDTQLQSSAGKSSTVDDSHLLGQHGPELEYIRAKQQIEILRAERGTYAHELRPKHPIMIDFDQRIAQQQQLIDTFRKQSTEDLQRRREGAKLEIQNLEKTIQQTESKALELSQRLAEYNSIQASINRQRAQLESLSREKGTVEISRNVDQDIVSIRQDATPAMPAKPGMVRAVVIATLFGLAMGLAFLFLIDQFDDRVASFSEFQVHFPDRVLSQIPSVARRGSDDFLKPLSAKDERHAFAEAFRALRSSLIFLPLEGTRPKILLVTSGVPNDGKSTIVTNLSITLALSSLRVLLIDGDLRRGQIHAAFNLPNERGCSDVLAGRCTVEEAVQATKIPGLFLLSRGAAVPDPGELYLSKSTDQFLQTIYDQYDYILLDSSPVMAADDTTSLAPKVDAILFVFRFTSSHIRISQKALALLRERQANVIGVVCNDVSEAMQEYYYYRYPEYYGPQSKSEGRKANA